MHGSTRQGIGRLIASIDVRAASLPPEAVLLVRRLADPRPHTLDAGDSALHPPPAWERAFQDSIDRVARQAARPATGPVSPSAPAVVFLDPAELLACLAHDFLQGCVSGNWWWQAWLRATGQSTLKLVFDAWVREARHAPAAMGTLEDRGLASRFAGALSPREARMLFVAVTEAYDLPALAAPTPPVDVPIMPPRISRPRVARRAVVPPHDNPAEASQAPSTDGVSAPWELLVPSSSMPATLGIEQRTLTGIALALWRAPLAVRTQAFHRAFHAWRRAEQFEAEAARATPPGHRSSDVPEPAVGSVEKPAAPIGILAREGEARPALVQPLSPPAHAAPIPPPLRMEVSGGPNLPNALPQAPPHEEAATAMPSTPGAERAVSHSGAPPPNGPVRSAPEPVVAAAAAKPAKSVAPSGGVLPAPTSPSVGAVSAPERMVYSVRTRLAGVLFLINALKRLELFDRLDDHFGVRSSIGGWAWLEILARSLLGGRRRDAATDSIWDVLASLDGRDPGAAVFGTFRGPRSYRLPESWPAPDRTDPASGRRRRGRPLGFKPAGSLRRFLDTLVPYLRWRLVKGMTLDGSSARDEDALLVSRLLYRRGRLSCTRTHVDLHMGMDQVDIAVRLAGLDAHPGWVPSLGRVVTFYYD
jgi:hypothetical protein